MMRRLTSIIAVAALLVLAPSLRAQETSPLGGIWTFNRSLSDLPKEIGFNVSWMPAPEGGRGAGSSGGGRGRRSGGGGGGGGGGSTAPISAPRESSEDYSRLQLITSQVRNPPARITVVDTTTAFTITNELGQSRTFHPNGTDEWIQIEGVSIRTNARRDGERVVALYHVEADRDVRYTFTPSKDPRQLIVDVEFLERGKGDKARLVYQPGLVTDTATPAAAPATGPPGIPAAPAPTREAEKFDQRPGAELRGLKTLGILVEDLGAAATACGLNRDAVETALMTRLRDAGFTVRRNSDDDTYVYVNVMTANVGGACVTRYDAFLYTQATANLSYRDQPVLVQVSLMHRGGIASTGPPTHAATVTRGLENYIDLFVSQIRDANK